MISILVDEVACYMELVDGETSYRYVLEGSGSMLTFFKEKDENEFHLGSKERQIKFD